MGNETFTIAVCGAGTMGAGIAQVAAQSGLPAVLFDLKEEALEKAKISIRKNLLYLREKNKIDGLEQEAVFNRIRFVNDIKECKASLIIEAIIEKEEAKVGLFKELAKYNSSEAIFTSNTSSLSITSLQNKLEHPERIAGMHFFNPAYAMKLVEVVKGDSTSEATVKAIVDVCRKLGKQPVICKDAPGFIVNRVARHFYLESLKIVEEGIASFEEVDDILESAGFKMGPFRLMDLIGMDINLAVSESLYEAYSEACRFRPSPLQQQKVAKNELGKKTGKGFYIYQQSGKA